MFAFQQTGANNIRIILSIGLNFGLLGLCTVLRGLITSCGVLRNLAGCGVGRQKGTAFFILVFNETIVLCAGSLPSRQSFCHVVLGVLFQRNCSQMSCISLQ